MDDDGQLRELIGVLEEVAKRLPVVFPDPPPHTQPPGGATTGGSRHDSDSAARLPEFLRLTDQARLVLTDSGGIQEETTILRVPCLTLRENTERPVTIEKGTNRLVGTRPDDIRKAALETLDQPLPTAADGPELWDGKASGRIRTCQKLCGGKPNS